MLINLYLMQPGKSFRKIFKVFFRFLSKLLSIMMRTLFTFLGLIGFFLSSHALPVTIDGKSAAGDAFVFRLYEQKDPISGLEVLLDQARPNDEGQFVLNFSIDHIKEVTIRVGLQSMSFIAIPGKTYDLQFNEITLEDQNVFLPLSRQN